MKPKGEKTADALGRLWGAQRRLVVAADALGKLTEEWRRQGLENDLREAALAYASLGTRLLRRDA